MQIPRFLLVGQYFNVWFFFIYFVLEFKKRLTKLSSKSKVDGLRYNLAVKEEESCTCPTFYDSRGSSILNNFSIEYNMTDLNQSLRPLENNIDMSPTKFGNLILLLYFLRLHQ